MKEAGLHKTDPEVELLRRSAGITEDAIQAAVDIAKEGITEKEVAVAFNRHLVEQGSEPVIGLYGSVRTGLSHKCPRRKRR